MKKFYNKKFVNILFAISVVTLLILNIFVYLNLKSQFKTSETTQKFLELSGITTEFYSKVIEAETNRRGFLITNNTVFLNSYTSAINSIDSVYGILYSFLNADSSFHGIIDSLAGLVKLRKDLWQESIVIQGKGGFKESRIQSEYMNKGRILMVKIKGLIDRILINARENIESGYSEEIKSSRATFTNLITGSSIALLLLIFSVYVLNKNITKRTISESNFQQSTRRLSTILESIGDGVIVTDGDGNVQFLNKAAALITGWTVEQAKGIPIEKVFDIINENTNLPQENPVRKVISTRKVAGLANNTVLRTKAGELKPVDDSASPIIGDDYDFAGVVLVFRDISEKHRAHKLIIENQRLIQKIADSLPGVIYIYIPDEFKITFVNYKVSQMLGYKPEQIIASGKNFLIQYIHPDDRRKFKNIYRIFSALNNNQALEHEYRIRNSRGEYRWFRSYEVVFSRDSNSMPREILGFAFDVTERRALEEQIAGYREHLEELVATRTNELDIINKQLKDEIKQRIRAEQEIRETEEKFRNLVENSPVGIYIVKDGKIAYVNNRFAGIFGYSPDELIGIDLVNLVIDDHKETARDHIRRGFLGEADSMNISISCYKSDGTIIDINIYGTTIILNNEMAVIGTVIDVTEQNKLFRDIQKWNEKFNLIVESSGAIVYDYNVVTGDIIWGGSVTSILGYTQQEFSGGILQWESLIHPDDREEAVALLAEAEKKGKAYEVEYRFKKKDGSYIWIYDKGFFVYDAGGNAIQMMGMMQDINVRKLYEQEIQRERNLFIGGPVVLFRWQNKEGWPVEYVSSNINQYGYTPEDFTEHKIKYADIIHPDDLERIAGEVKYYTENNYSNYEQYYRIKKSDGTYIHLYDFTVVVKNENNEVTHYDGYVFDITELKTIEEELKRQKDFLRTIIDTDPNFIFAKNWNGQFTLVNKAVADVYGTTVKDLIGKTDADFNSNKQEVENFIAADREVMSTGISKLIPEEPVTNSITGETRWYQTIKIPLKTPEGETQVLGISTDITARKIAAEITLKSLREKEALLKEIHHRVKNNLQIIVSLIKLQSKYCYDHKDYELFLNTRSRVETLALVHSKFYGMGDISTVRISGIFNDLLVHIIKFYNTKNYVIDYKIDAGDLQLNIDNLIPSALIVNEIVINIISSSFSAGLNGMIELNVSRDNDLITFRISDNGVCISEKLSLDSTDTMGIKLIETLVKQLNGNFSYQYNGGNIFTFSFNEIKYTERF